MDNEPGVISVFKEALRDAAQQSGKPFKDFPLGSQDRQFLADDLWTTYDNFALVESKAGEHKLSTEYKDKDDRTKKLCEELHRNTEMAELHAKCHRIAWRENETGRLLSSEYRRVVCLEGWPKTCPHVYTNKPLTIDIFTAGFFGEPPNYSLPAEDFKRYVRWLTKTITGETRDIVVLARKIINGETIAASTSLNELAACLTTTPKLNTGNSSNKMKM
ncbi:MAG: hypothetical protein RLZZ298_44 [Pseudomonadota bacterium]